MAYGSKKPGALAILIPHGKGGGNAPPDSGDEESGDLPGEFMAKFQEYYDTEDNKDSTVEDCARTFYAAVKAAMGEG